MERHDPSQHHSFQQCASNIFPVDNLVNQLDQMAVDARHEDGMSLENHLASFNQQSRDGGIEETLDMYDEIANEEVLSMLGANSDQSCRTNDVCPDTSKIAQKDRTQLLVVTYPRQSNVSWSEPYKAQFESLFQAYDPDVKFHYMPKTCRVRLTLTSEEQAELAHSRLGEFCLGDITFKCFPLDPIKMKPLSTIGNSNYLQIPQAKRMFLISPPPSPPEGWAPRAESPPVIDVQLISALSNLLPGQVHKIHAATGTQPSIFVEVCEDNHRGAFVASKDFDCQYSTRIPKTMNPAARMENNF